MEEVAQNTAQLTDRNSQGQHPYSYGWWDIMTGKARSSAAQTSFEARAQDIANEFNANEAAKARNFEEYMSNTAYQRAKADAEAAGINLLNATNQQGSTPSGAAAQATKASAKEAGGNGFASLIVGLAKIAVGIATGNAKATATGTAQAFGSIGGKQAKKEISQIINRRHDNRR